MAEASVSKSFAENREAGSCSDGALSPCANQSQRRGHVTSTERRGYNATTWLNLVCLDAPLVAIAWQWLFAETFAVPVSAGSRATLFLTAWLIYLADRWGDVSSSLHPAMPTSLRQRFCFRHRKAWRAAIAIVGSADGILVGTLLDARTVAVGAAVGGVALGYLILNHRRSDLWRVLPVKEALIGFLFATGVMVALVKGLTLDLLPAWVLFGGVCTLNCISIAVWERELDLAQRRVSIATVFSASKRVVLPVLFILATVCFAFGFTAFGRRGLYLSLATSALLLALLHIFRNRVDRDNRTALADVVLLTPLSLLIAQAL